MGRNLYMTHLSNGPAAPSLWERARAVAPYFGCGLLLVVVVANWSRVKPSPTTSTLTPVPRRDERAKDWTQKLSLKNQGDGVEADNRVECPLPVGNWPHTCDRAIIVEGPCSGKCLLKAKCEDLSQGAKETTFEYAEGEVFELKNVNGLLCEADSMRCGVNFHGNIALKNCDGLPPHRHVTHPEGKATLSEKPPGDDGDINKVAADEDMDVSPPPPPPPSRRRRSTYEDDEFRGRGRGHRQYDDDWERRDEERDNRDRRRDDDEEDVPPRRRRSRYANDLGPPDRSWRGHDEDYHGVSRRYGRIDDVEDVPDRRRYRGGRDW